MVGFGDANLVRPEDAAVAVVIRVAASPVACGSRDLACLDGRVDESVLVAPQLVRAPRVVRVSLRVIRSPAAALEAATQA